jgi:magnesium chelatase family protein
MGTAKTITAAVIGTQAHLVEAEAALNRGLPSTILAGLPETSLREARDRIRAAILNSGHEWPRTKITIGLSPANLPKRGGAFDLAIAVAILAADEAIPRPPRGILFHAELGLDGTLRPVRGVLPAVAAAPVAGLTTAVVAPGNADEADSVPGIDVLAPESFTELEDWLRGDPPPRPALPPPSALPTLPAPGHPEADFRDYPATPGGGDLRGRRRQSRAPRSLRRRQIDALRTAPGDPARSR